MKGKTILLLSAAYVIAFPVPAMAQDQQQTAAPDSEIIITARKREEAAIDVPVIATTLSEERLDQLGVRDLKDITRLVPGLTLSQNTGILGMQPSLRGVGTNAINAGIDQSISLNVDGLQLTQGVSYSAAMFDLERVEVLKGPQPLFFGKNSPAGVIAVRSADPGDELEIMARFGYEPVANENRTELIFSTPITDTLGIRIAALYDRAEGYFKNIASGAVFGGRDPLAKRNPNTENVLIRGTLLFTPGDQFDARLKVVHSRDHMTGGFGNQFVSCPDGAATNTFVVNIPPALGGGSVAIPFLGGEDCKKDRFFRLVDFDTAAFGPAQGTEGVPNNGIGFTDTDQDYGTLELNYRPMPELTVTSVTAYYKLDIRSGNNGSLATQAGPPFISAGVPLSRKELTQEVRINSDWESPLNFTAGAFYQDAKLINNVRLITNTALPFPLTFALPRPLGAYDQTVDIKTISAFGQLRWQATPELEIAGGVRWTNEKRKLTFETLIPLNPPTGFVCPPPGAPCPFPAGIFPTSVPKISSDNLSPELTITYEATENLTFFAAAKRGYKSGSFNLTAPTFASANTDFSFGDEKVTGAEAGVKARLLDRQMFVSLAAYYYKYKGLQVGVVTPIAAGGVPVNRTINAGGAKAYGVDLEMTYDPDWIDGLNLRAAVAWNIAKFTDLRGVPCWGGQSIEEGCTVNPRPATAAEILAGQFFNDPALGPVRFTGQDLTGEPLNRAPKWQANFGFSYETPIGGNLVLALTNENQFLSRQRTNLGLRDDFFQKAYFKTDASIALRDAEDRWEFAVIGKNLTDKLTTSNCNNTNSQAGAVFGGQITGAPIASGRGPAGVDEVACFMDRGREIWLRFTFRGRK